MDIQGPRRLKKNHKYSLIAASFALASLAVGSDLAFSLKAVAMSPAIIITCFYGYSMAGKFKSRE